MFLCQLGVNRHIDIFVVDPVTGLGAVGQGGKQPYLVLGAGASVQTTNTLAEVDAVNMPGVYSVLLLAAELSAAGPGLVQFRTAALNGVAPIQVVGFDPDDAVRGGLTALPNAAAAAVGGVPVVGTQVPNAVAGALNGLPVVNAGGAVKVSAPLLKNTAFANFMFVMTDDVNHEPAAGLVVTATRSIDGGAFGAGTLGAVTNMGGGIYKLNLGAGDLNGANIVLLFQAVGADDRIVQLTPFLV